MALLIREQVNGTLYEMAYYSYSYLPKQTAKSRARRQKLTTEAKQKINAMQSKLTLMMVFSPVFMMTAVRAVMTDITVSRTTSHVHRATTVSFVSRLGKCIGRETACAKSQGSNACHQIFVQFLHTISFRDIELIVRIWN